VKPLPLFPVTVVGSWPRPPELLRAQRRLRRGESERQEIDRTADAAVLAALQVQEEVGVDVVSDGEQRRDNFYSFVADKLEGVRLMSLAQMLDVVEDRAGFERLLQTLDVPAYAIHSPTCDGRVRRREPLALDEYHFLRRHTARPIKVPLPGPYLLTRAMWVKEITGAVYATKEALAEDVVALLREELDALAGAGVDFVQFYEPVLTEVAFNPTGTRTFMCAALSARADPAEELEWAVSLLNRVLQGFEDRLRTGLHICRGNWSRDERTLLAGSYAPLAPYLALVNVRQLVLEFATPRAGELGALLGSEDVRTGKELGLGVVNPRSEEVETVDQVVARAEEALRFLPPDRLFLNPDCGFGTLSSRPVNVPQVARRKLEVIVQAAEKMRER